jgi:HK97 family phage major capsid protein
MQIRKADLGKPDLEARTVPVVLATDYPVQRHGFLEVLDTSKADLSRGDLPLIESHDHNTLNIGVVRNVRAEGGKLRGLAQFGTSARASEVLADVQAGIVTGVSIGYSCTDEGEPFTLADGRQARRFGFMPFEVSAVAIPADPLAGFNKRSHTLTLKGKPIMENTTTAAPETRNHAAEIAEAAAGSMFPSAAEIAMRSINAGHTLKQFQNELILSMATKPLRSAGLDSYHQEHRELGTATMLRTADDFRRHYSTRGDSQSMGLADWLRGAARMKTTPEVTRNLSVGVDSAGGFTVPHAVMPGILAALAPASSLIAAGAPIIPLEDGAKSYSFAAVDTLPTASWRLENGLVAQSAPTFRNVMMTPRSLSFVVKISRELLADGINIETALNQAIAQAFAAEIDRAGLRGTGTAPEIRGLLNTANVQAVTNGAAGAVLGSYANVFTGVQRVLEANGPMPTAAIMSPRSLVRLGALADTTGQPLMVPTMLQPVKMLQTSQIPNTLTVGASTDCSEIFIGDFSQFVIGLREQLSVQVLQESYADNGQIGFMCHARLDVAALYPRAFAIVTGVR